MKKRWIVDRLRERGLLQRDLAAVWGIADAGVSRWLTSNDYDDLPLSRACKLADLLSISLPDLASRLGFAEAPPPTTETARIAAALPLGSWLCSEGPGDALLLAVHLRAPAQVRD